MITQGYNDPKNLRYRAGQPAWMPVVLHAFPKLVDEYIYKYGTVSQTPSRMIKGKNDIMVTIPAKLNILMAKKKRSIHLYN